MSEFVGGYVQDKTEVLTASLLAKQNAIILGAPGWGKTAVARSLAEQLTGGKYSFIRVDPSTPPDVVRGPYNPAAMLDGRLERVVDGTPYDPAVLLAIVDEIGRSNEVMFDALLDTLDRVGNHAPPVWATSNFMPSNERVEALIDRFALWFWVQPGSLDAEKIVDVQLTSAGRPTVNTNGLPTWSQIEDVHNAKPGPNAIKAVGNLITDLGAEAANNGRQLHPRRVSQWSHLLFRVGMWYAGDTDFKVVPDQASRLLRYAWPALSPAEAGSWAQIAGSVVDTLGAAIETVELQVLEKMQQYQTADAHGKANLLGEVGSTMQNALTSLENLAGKDNPRVEESTAKMNKWLQLMTQGKEIK